MRPADPEACPEGEIALHAFLDGELDAVHASHLERHLEACPSCAAEIAGLEAQRARLRQDSVRWRAPEHLRAQIIGALVREDTRRPASGYRGLTRFLDRAGRWSLLPSAAALAAAFFLVLGMPRPITTLPSEIVASHVRSLLVDHLTDVATSDQHTVKPWFTGKIEFSPPVVDLGARGFPLVGGRIDYLGGRVVAALVYRRGGHVINLFVWPDAAPPGSIESRDGFTVLPWSADGLRFVAVSDVAEPELARFRDLFQTSAQIAPSSVKAVP